MADTFNFPELGPFLASTASPYVFGAPDAPSNKEIRVYQWTFVGNGTITVGGVLPDNTVIAGIGTTTGNAVIVSAGAWVAYEITFGTATEFKAYGRRLTVQF